MSLDDIYARIKQETDGKNGARKIAKKMGEEAVELAIAATSLREKPESEKRREQLKEEAADLLLHYLTLLAHFGITPGEIIKTLEKR